MKPALERTLQVLLTLTALILLAVGNFREHKVYEKSQEQFGLRNYTDISEYQLVEDATFSGTVRLGDDLVGTYDRTAPKGKTPCPT